MLVTGSADEDGIKFLLANESVILFLELVKERTVQ
jgi:hypothetical protein